MESGSYRDKKGEVVHYKKFDNEKLYWTIKAGVRNMFYMRDGERCYFSNNDKNERVEYRIKKDGKKHYYKTRKRFINYYCENYKCCQLNLAVSQVM